MPAATVNVGPLTVTYLHEDPASGYALLQWEAPPGAASPPLHVHHRTDEGFYVVSGTYRFLLDGETIDAPAGAHVQVPAGAAHTFWNSGDVPARCLIILTPPDFAPYFRELSAGLTDAKSDEDSIEVRRRLSARFDIEVIGPPINP
jgi:mannose-6-phosphate isomerase-like protein (cupin superfamily)